MLPLNVRFPGDIEWNTPFWLPLTYLKSMVHAKLLVLAMAGMAKTATTIPTSSVAAALLLTIPSPSLIHCGTKTDRGGEGGGGG
jgi:hypothetical protein